MTTDPRRVAAVIRAELPISLEDWASRKELCPNLRCRLSWPEGEKGLTAAVWVAELPASIAIHDAEGDPYDTPTATRA